MKHTFWTLGCQCEEKDFIIKKDKGGNMGIEIFPSRELALMRASDFPTPPEPLRISVEVIHEPE